jgi:tetratricopeptide (TPR) repeat protein
MDRSYRILRQCAVAAIALGCAAGTSADDIEAASAQGTSFAEAGHHEEAIPALQRALALQRSQYGLFDVRQMETLKVLAISLTALNRLPEAQDLLIYRARVAEKTYGEGDVKVVAPLCDLADWFSETGKSPEARLTFITAMNIVTSQRSPRDLMLLEPLRGIARTYMRRASYPEQWLYPPSPPSCSAPGENLEPCFPPRMDSGGKRIVGTRKLDSEGEEALQRALAIVESDMGAPVAMRIETLIQLGDWYQIKKSPREATSYYRRALQLIRSTPGLPRSTASAFDVPLRLSYPTPQIVAYIPTVPPEEVQAHYVQIEFTVAADGSVANARVADKATNDRYVRGILDAVKASRFRPKFVADQAVATSGVSYRETFRTAKPRT